MPVDGLLIALAAVILLAALAIAVEPTALPPTLPPVLEGGDLRSEGAGPGLVGNPLLILGAVVVLGIGTVLVTLVVARLARRV